MSTMLKHARRALLSLAVVLGLLSVGASTAAAVPAYFTGGAPGAGMRALGDLTVTNGTTTYSCPNSVMWPATGGDAFLGYPQVMQCSRPGHSGMFSIHPVGFAEKNGSAYSLRFTYYGAPTYNTIYPGHTQSTFSVPFINASGANPSKIVFNNTLVSAIGTTPQIRATGTLNVTNGVTLN